MTKTKAKPKRKKAKTRTSPNRQVAYSADSNGKIHK